MPVKKVFVATTSLAAADLGAPPPPPPSEKVIADKDHIAHKQGKALVADDTPLMGNGVAMPRPAAPPVTRPKPTPQPPVQMTPVTTVVRHAPPPPEPPPPPPEPPRQIITSFSPPPAPPPPPEPPPPPPEPQAQLILQGGISKNTLGAAFDAIAPRPATAVADMQPANAEVRAKPMFEQNTLNAPIPTNFTDPNAPMVQPISGDPALVVTGANAADAIKAAAPAYSYNEFTQPALQDALPPATEIRQELRKTASQIAKAQGPRRI